MSTLTSSAVHGRKAAPRAPPKRRAAAKASEGDASQAHPGAAATTTTTEAQVASSTPGIDARGPPSPPVVVERQLPPTIAVERELPVPINEATPTDASPGTQQESGAPAQVETRRTQRTRKRANAPSETADITTSNKRPRVSKTRVEPANASASQPGSSTISNQVPSSELPATENPEQASTSTTRAAPKRTRAGGRRTRATATQDQNSGAIDPAIVDGAHNDLSTDQVASNLASQLQSSTQSASTQPKPRRQRKKKPTAETIANEDAEAATQDQEHDDDSNEKHEIDPATLSMFELSHDTRHGKSSEREKKMAQIDWAEVARKRREEADAIARGDTQPEQHDPNIVQSTEGDDGNRTDQDNADQTEDTSARPGPTTRPSGGGVRFRLVAGQLVEDEESMVIDRAARVTQAAADVAGETIEEENDLTVRFNRTTYINSRKRDPTDRVPLWRAKSDAWTEEDTDRFYDALRMFGTDFFIISKMFPPRTRKQIKLKFVREERLEPDRINAALLGRHTRRIDLDHYAQAINRDVADFHKYDSLEHATAVIRESMKDKEEEMRAAVKEEEENNRQREAQRQQRERQRIEAEKKKEERAKKKAMSRRGYVFGAGTLGGADDDNDDFQNE